MRILIIEDDDDILQLLYTHLEEQEMVVDSASDGVTGLHRAVCEEFDAIVLDINLPGINGLDLCRRLRGDAASATPIIMLTANDELESKIEAFEAGADDYLVKPFEPSELSARLTAIVRRSTKAKATNKLTVEDLTLDLDTLSVTRAGQEFHLSPISIRMLELLMRESPKLVTRESLEHHIWSDDPPDSDSLRAHVYALRNAIDKPFPTPLLHTVPRLGYKLAAE